MFDYFYGQSGEMFSYFRVPKILFRDIKFKDLSTDAKTLYGILLDRMGLSVKNGWLDEQGRVYIIFPVQEVMDALGCADNKATKLFRELEKFGLIERKRRGLGKPNLIYVKNFADPRFRNREKNGSGAADSAQQETAKSRGNKTEWNKTEGSEPDPFSSDAEDESDERTRLEAYFMQSLEVDLLLRACPDEEDTIHQIVNLLVDTCSSKRRMLRVAGDDKPAEVVRSRFMKLNVLERHCNQAKIPVISAHGLRHTHASVLLFAGVSIASVARRLGHSSMTTTQKTYLHIIRELENQDIDLVMRSLSGLS